MEIERLPLGQSRADKCRAAILKWRNMPPGIPPETAVDFMARLQAASTIRKLTSGIKKFGPGGRVLRALQKTLRTAPRVGGNGVGYFKGQHV
jgi:hypothetical protein